MIKSAVCDERPSIECSAKSIKDCATHGEPKWQFDREAKAKTAAATDQSQRAISRQVGNMRGVTIN
jgi:hypothetical protein